jgi:hypothetical protein
MKKYRLFLVFLCACISTTHMCGMESGKQPERPEKRPFKQSEPIEIPVYLMRKPSLKALVDEFKKLDQIHLDAYPPHEQRAILQKKIGKAECLNLYYRQRSQSSSRWQGLAKHWQEEAIRCQEAHDDLK